MKKFFVILLMLSTFTGVFASGVSSNGFGLHQKQGGAFTFNARYSGFFVTNSFNVGGGFKYAINENMAFQGGLNVGFAACNLDGYYGYHSVFEIMPEFRFWFKEFFISHGIGLEFGDDFRVAPSNIHVGWSPKFWNWGSGVGGLEFGMGCRAFGIYDREYHFYYDDYGRRHWVGDKRRVLTRFTLFAGVTFDL